MLKFKSIYLLLVAIGLACQVVKSDDVIKVGAENMGQYLSDLKNKNVAVVANQTSVIPIKLNDSVINYVHLIDTLLEQNVNLIKIFAPEHGFRGMADAGEHVADSIDIKTGLPIVSLYGQNKKLPPNLLSDIDVVVFDIQDVGARFYTYLSTLHYVMEACAITGKKLIVLDRPNPNGHYIDGPVLEKTIRIICRIAPSAHCLWYDHWRVCANDQWRRMVEKWCAVQFKSGAPSKLFP